MGRNPTEWKELRSILVVIILSTAAVSLLEFTKTDIPRLSILTLIFLLYLMSMIKRQHLT
jgi:hypothetical protein